jgi:hypothetical protein
MSDDGLFPDNYSEFLKKRDTAKGHDFEEVPEVSAVPPTVTFIEKLRWWSLNRWKRMKKIREERDRRLQEIIRLKTPPKS